MARLVIPSFAGGLWSSHEGDESGVPPDALLIANNVEYRQAGGIIGRRGRTKLNSSALSGPVRELWRHYPRTGTKNTLAFVDVGGSVTAFKADDSSGTFSSATTGLPDDARYSFANWPQKNKSFIVSSSGGLRQWNGTAVSSVTASGTNEVDLTNLGPYITVHKSRLFASNVDELNYSVYASEVNDETTWLSVSQLSFNDPQGGAITGIQSFNSFLLVFKEGSLWRFVGDISTTLDAQKDMYSDRGCVAPDSIAVSPYGIFYVGRNGVYITEGTSPNPPDLSLPIKDLWISKTANQNYPNAVGRWYQNKQQYVLKLDPSHAYVYVLQRLEILAENVYVDSKSRVVWLWSKHTSLPMISAAVWESETDDGRLVTGDANGYVWIYDTGSLDDAAAIEATIQTASVPIDNTISRNPARDAQFLTGRVKQVKVYHKADAALTGEVLYDQASPGAGASFTVGGSTLAQKFPRAIISNQTLVGRFVSIWLRNTASDADFELHLFDLKTRLMARRVWRDDNDTLEDEVVSAQGHVTIADTNTEATVTFAVAQPNTDYEVAFGMYPSTTSIGPTTVGIKPGTKTTTGFTAEIGGSPGAGESYTIMWILSRAS